MARASSLRSANIVGETSQAGSLRHFQPVPVIIHLAWERIGYSNAVQFPASIRSHLMRSTRLFSLLAAMTLMLVSAKLICAESPTLKNLLIAVNQTGPGGDGHDAAMTAMNNWLADGSPEDQKLIATLDAMSDANDRGKNWLRLAAGSLREELDDEALSSTLKTFIDNRGNDPAARYWAYRQWSALPSTTDAMNDAVLDAGRDDPSIPLRYLAVQKAIDDADAIFKKENESPAAIESLAATLPLARHPDQLREISSRLTDRGVKVDLSKELAMVTRWWTIGPFSNTDSKHFDTVYPPEQTYAASPMESVDTDAAVAAGEKTVTWKVVATDEAMGLVDFTEPYEKVKDAIIYAYAKIEISEEDLKGPDGTASVFEARLGSINANKIWVNGKLVGSNEIYHSGSSIDQYAPVCPLRAGVNTVLLKICQNNQTDSWAQEFEFRFRFTDATGRGIPHTIVVPQ